MLGLQTEIDKNECHDDSLKSNIINSTLVERMVVSTYGSFLAESLSSWSEQVLKLGKYYSLKYYCPSTNIFLDII